MGTIDFLKATSIASDIKIEDQSNTLTRMQKSEESKDSVVKIKTCCRACIAACGVIATVKNGRVIKVEGNPEDPMTKGRLCAKGLSGIHIKGIKIGSRKSSFAWASRNLRIPSIMRR